MNAINSYSQVGTSDRILVPAQETLGRSLARLSGDARIGVSASAGPDAIAAAEHFDAHGKRVQSALIDVQHATSAVQSADRFLGGLTETLALMRESASDSSNGVQQASAADTQKFQAQQQQLRDAMAATVPSIGVGASPKGTFDARDVAGPEAPSSSLGTSGTPASSPPFTLRGGAIHSLVQQDGAGQYLLAATDPLTREVLKLALQDVADARGAVATAGTRLQLEAVTLQVEFENLSSALAPVRDEVVGGELTRAATSSMLTQPGAALFAQANLSPQGAFQLLER